MKLLLIRHGESEDDILNAYGGWADFPLTTNGLAQVKAAAEKIKPLGEQFDIILTSPLKRALQTSEILSNTLGTKVEIFEYVKERNSYGLLSGMEKTTAQQKYPWLVEAYTNDDYVDGSERIEDMKNRAIKAYELISKMPYDKILVVTHGNFLKSFFSEVFSMKLTKKDDAGYILLEISDDGNEDLNILKSDGIEIQ